MRIVLKTAEQPRIVVAKEDVPKDGCPSPAVSDTQIKENLDDKKPRKNKTPTKAAK